jgi:hypothetical protein
MVKKDNVTEIIEEGRLIAEAQAQILVKKAFQVMDETHMAKLQNNTVMIQNN